MANDFFVRRSCIILVVVFVLYLKLYRPSIYADTSLLALLEGDAEYDLHFNPSDMLSASQKHYAATQLKLFKTWYRTWAAAKA